MHSLPILSYPILSFIPYLINTNPIHDTNRQYPYPYLIFFLIRCLIKPPPLRSSSLSFCCRSCGGACMYVYTDAASLLLLSILYCRGTTCFSLRMTALSIVDRYGAFWRDAPAMLVSCWTGRHTGRAVTRLDAVARLL